MDDFLNRITAQRQVIRIVNQKADYPIHLTGLSSKALERWKYKNAIPDDSDLLKVIYLIASKLFFLANKSQEQITNDYKLLSKTVQDLISHLDSNIKKYAE